MKRPHQLYINGEWTDGDQGRRFAVYSPRSDDVIADVIDATPADALHALDAACGAEESWCATPPRERSELLRALFHHIVDDTKRFAECIEDETGKPQHEAEGEVRYGAEFLRWFSEEAVRIYGTQLAAPSGRGRISVKRHPVGPCLLITPWNFPLAMPTRKIGAALAAGCTVVLKPAEDTPLTSLMIAEAAHAVGIPKGVLNVVCTSSPESFCAPLFADPRLRKLSFTGSSATGKHLVRAAAGNLLRTSMELGGNAPFIVCEDADLAAAIQGALAAKLRNAGQACISVNRFLVHESLEARFCEALNIGMDNYEAQFTPAIGPMINRTQRDRADAMVKEAISLGAKVIRGGHPPKGAGAFYPTTILSSIPENASLLRDEVFAPVASVTTFKDDMQAIQLANHTRYGLAAYVYTQSLARAHHYEGALKTGMLGINRGSISDPAAPFGGVGDSGFGREGGAEGISEYLETKYTAYP